MLILESELNRALLIKEAEELKGEIHKVAKQARSMGSLISTAAPKSSAVTMSPFKRSRLRAAAGTGKTRHLRADGASSFPGS